MHNSSHVWSPLFRLCFSIAPLYRAAQRAYLDWDLTCAQLRLVASACLAAIAIATLSGCTEEHNEYVKGRGQAQRDLAHGEYKIAIAEGTNMPAFWEYANLLRKRYHISCGVYYAPYSNHCYAEAWARGYNEVASPRIDREIVSQVLEQTMVDAKKLHEAAMAKTSH